MSIPSSGAFIFGSAASGNSVLDAIASYRRAQYYVAGSHVASSGEEANHVDEEAEIESNYSEDRNSEDLEHGGRGTSIQVDGFVGQFHWDGDEDIAPASIAPPSPSSYASRMQRNTEIVAEVAGESTSSTFPANEVTPLLRPKVSFSRLSIQSRREYNRGPSGFSISGSRVVESADETLGNSGSQPPHSPRPLPRRSSTSSSKTNHKVAHFGGQSTFGQTLFNSIAILLGIGVLSEPLAFAYAGWILGTILIVSYGFLSCYTAKILARIIKADPRLRSYADIGRKAFGPRSTLFISIMFCLELFAVSVVLVTLYADSLHAVIPTYSANTYKVWGLLLLIPTVFLPLSVLSYTSILGILSTVLLVFVVLGDGLTKKDHPGSLWNPAHTSLNFSSWTNLGLAYGLFMAGFSGHAVIPSLARDMANPEDFDTMINWAFIVATSIYTLIGYVGYLMFGENVSDEISTDLLKTSGYNPYLNEIALWMLVVSPLSKFALTTQPLNSALEVLFGTESAVSTPEDMAMKMAGSIWDFFSSLQRILVTLASVSVSIAVPEFSAMMAFLGSFSAFMLCIIGPVAAKVALERECGLADGVILAIGVVMAVWGTGPAIVAASSS
ncbi:hypothetical protein E1B28_001242 [Marasmius oreades]|uniref:Amino acid transporter transmembrane domain-containing protein n=1 Tax=Marasmius oreades TaxID=181124 RepID=A0A9P8AF72_9AGAR|nr:uncharacterized protein E1B28_001242 [Marasmius oreades]KAG7099387.1 hypothetical protein E1B28_001242 [Marasmius oreades]